MPFKSDAQRRWGHSDEGEKALGGPEKVNEWDQATKGKKLPEKLADGGLVQEKQPDEFTQDMKSGVNGDLDAVKDFIMKIYGKAQNGPVMEGPTLQGFHDTMAANQGIPNSDGQMSGAVGGYCNGGMPGYDEGGVVPDTGFDANSGMPPPPQMPSQAPQMPVQAPNPVLATPDMSDYINRQKGALDQYGPAQQMAVQNSILQRQNSPGSLLGQGLAGLGDAISTGVGRSSNPGFLNSLQNRQAQQGQMQMEGMKNAQEGQVQNIAAKQKLDAMDPKSTLSKSVQQSQGLVLGALGFDPKTIGMMSASEIPEAVSTLKDLGLKEREIMVAKYKAQIEANALAETTRAHRAEEGQKGQELAETAKQHGVEAGLKGQEIQAGQLEKAAAVPMMTQIANKLGGNKAAGALQAEALGTPAPGPVSHVTSQADYDALPPGTHFVDATGQRKIKGSK